MEKDWTGLSKKEIDKMEKIAKSAAKFFNEKGYLETSMDDISAAAKLSKGEIYHYFSRKNEIFYFISTNYMNIFLKDLEQKLKRINDLFLKIRYIVSRQIGHRDVVPVGF